MWTQDTTKITIGIIFVALVAADILLYELVGNDATFSKAMQSLGNDWNLIIVAAGLLAGHFFVPRDESFTDWWSELKPYVLLITGVALARLAWSQGIAMSR